MTSTPDARLAPQQPAATTSPAPSDEPAAEPVCQEVLSDADVSSFIYLTNFCCEPTENISPRALHVWGMPTGQFSYDNGQVKDADDISVEQLASGNWHPYPLSVREVAFIADDVVVADVPEPDFDLALGYTGLVLTPRGPVKVLAPEREHCYLGGTADDGEFDDLPDRDTALTQVCQVAERLAPHARALGGVVKVLPDQDAGGENPHHLLQVLVPFPAVTGRFTSFEQWKNYLRAALAG